MNRSFASGSAEYPTRPLRQCGDSVISDTIIHHHQVKWRKFAIEHLGLKIQELIYQRVTEGLTLCHLHNCSSSSKWIANRRETKFLGKNWTSTFFLTFEIPNQFLERIVHTRVPKKHILYFEIENDSPVCILWWAFRWELFVYTLLQPETTHK